MSALGRASFESTMLIMQKFIIIIIYLCKPHSGELYSSHRNDIYTFLHDAMFEEENFFVFHGCDFVSNSDALD
jgi:hypothetical protein